MRSKHLSNVFVVDTNKKPLDPVHPGQARILLDSGTDAARCAARMTTVFPLGIDNDASATLDSRQGTWYALSYHRARRQGYMLGEC